MRAELCLKQRTASLLCTSGSVNSQLVNIPGQNPCSDDVTLTVAPHVQLGGVVGVGLGQGGHAGWHGGGTRSLSNSGGLEMPVRLMGVFWRRDGGGRGAGRSLRGAGAGCGGLAGFGSGGGVWQH